MKALNIKLILVLVLMSLSSWGQQGSLTQTDVNAVLHGEPSAGPQVEIQFQPGLYEINEGDSNRISHYLLVDRYINDPNRFIALYFPKNIHRTKTGMGKIFQIFPVRNGTALMLSPLTIDSHGNIIDMSQASREAPVFMLSRRPGRRGFPYALRAENQNSIGIRGMRGSGRRAPQLNGLPLAGVFASSDNDSHGTVMVENGVMTLADDLYYDETFNMITLNGGQGKFVGLQASNFDTMAQTDLSQDEFQRMAVFISGLWDRECLLVARRTVTPGVFRFDYYRSETRYILERLFPGRVNPRINPEVQY